MSTNVTKNKTTVPAAAPTGNFSIFDYIIMAVLAINILSIIKTWYYTGYDAAIFEIILFVLSLFILWLVNLGRKYMDKNSGNGILKVLIALIVLFQFPLIISAILSMAYIFIKGIFF